jgi:hypothetical protein
MRVRTSPYCHLPFVRCCAHESWVIAAARCPSAVQSVLLIYLRLQYLSVAFRPKSGRSSNNCEGAGGHAWARRCWQDHHPVQATHRRDSQYSPNRGYDDPTSRCCDLFAMFVLGNPARLRQPIQYLSELQRTNPAGCGAEGRHAAMQASIWRRCNTKTLCSPSGMLGVKRSFGRCGSTTSTILMASSSWWTQQTGSASRVLRRSSECVGP